MFQEKMLKITALTSLRHAKMAALVKKHQISSEECLEVEINLYAKENNNVNAPLYRIRHFYQKYAWVHIKEKSK